MKPKSADWSGFRRAGSPLEAQNPLKCLFGATDSALGRPCRLPVASSARHVMFAPEVNYTPSGLSPELHTPHELDEPDEEAASRH